MTQRDQETLAAIVGFIAEFKYPPTFRELGQRMGVTSSATVFQRLKRLQSLGVISFNPHQPRTIVVKDVA